LLKTALLILAVSVDGFAVSMGLGAAGIKIPFRPAAIISLTGAVFLALPVYFGDALTKYLPMRLCSGLSSLLLIVLGTVNILCGCDLPRHRKNEEQADCKKGMFRFLADASCADSDNSKDISCKEALALSAALSADSLVTGFGAGLMNINPLSLLLPAFVIGFVFVKAGAYAGSHMRRRKDVHLNLLCGGILILMAFIK
jgi:putative sporulation protein YtaF